MVIGRPFLSRAAEGSADGPIWELGGIEARSQKGVRVVVMYTTLPVDSEIPALSPDCNTM
jgi:hypothetical protein